MDKIQKNFKLLKEVEWSDSFVTFYLIKRKLVGKKAKYSVFNLNIDDDFEQQLKQISSKEINKKEKVEEYCYTEGDFENKTFGISVNETDFKEILNLLNNEDCLENKIETITDPKCLINSWAYVARFKVNDNILYSVRGLLGTWKLHKTKQITNLFFSDNMLMKMKKNEIFQIDEFVDFFSMNDIIYILNKKNFENLLNFRESLVKNRNKIVEEFTSIGLFVDAKEISKIIGNNKPLLRKLSEVKIAAYYKNSSFLKELESANNEENWGLEYINGKINITKENIDDILSVLTNSRLKSPINQESFDVDGKRRLGES